MKQIKYLLYSFGAILLFAQCETPESPNFTLSSSVDSPVIANSSFQFYGGSNALIDTTNADLNNLFQVDSENFITLSQEESFDFGDIEDAVPGIQVAPTAIETEVGQIRLSSFSSQNGDGNVGSAGFEDLTGESPFLQQGNPIPGASSPVPVNVDLNTDYFVSAQVKDGAILFTLRNNLGFDLDELTLELYSGNTSLGVVTFANLTHESTQTERFDLTDSNQAGDVDLRDINVDIEISWTTQTMKDDPGDIIVKSVEGENLVASEVEAVVPQQDFRASGITSFSDDEFSFTDQEHYVEIKTGELVIDQIINSIDVDIENLQITFPGLRTPPYTEADSLIIAFNGVDKIERNTTSGASRTVSLDDVRIYASNNQIDYNVYALTEDTQQSGSSDSRVIHETDHLNANVGLENLTIREAFGVIENKQVLLNTDVASDGATADIMSDIEAEVIEIDGIDDLSRRVQGIEFTRASLGILYQTNVEIPATIIGAFLGIDASGNHFYLSGAQGTETEVLPEDPTEKLVINGSPIPKENLIKFDIQSGESPDDVLSNTFNRDNSNITEFFNRLPTSIRFIGVANINSDGAAGRITNPVQFSPTLQVNIPLSLRAEQATVTDTTSANLEDLPGPEDDSMLEDGSITIRYENGIPLGIDLHLDFLNEEGNSLTTLPVGNETPIEFKAAAIGSGGFTSEATEDYTVISLNRSQLDLLNQTKNIRLSAGLSSSEFREVRIRDTDSVSISLSGKFTIQNTID
ncbi:MAG: hypothetical protein ACQERO_11255 [Bacteroidota bacterium]